MTDRETAVTGGFIWTNPCFCCNWGELVQRSPLLSSCCTLSQICCTQLGSTWLHPHCCRKFVIRAVRLYVLLRTSTNTHQLHILWCLCTESGLLSVSMNKFQRSSWYQQFKPLWLSVLVNWRMPDTAVSGYRSIKICRGGRPRLWIYLSLNPTTVLAHNHEIASQARPYKNYWP